MILLKRLLYILSTALTLGALPERTVWNRMNEIRGLVMQNDSSSAKLRKVSAIVSSGISVASTISSEISSATVLKTKTANLMERSRNLRSKGISILTNPAQKNRTGFSLALKQISDGKELKNIQLKSDRLLGVVRQAYHMVGELLGQQYFSDDVIMVDEELALLIKHEESMKTAVLSVNENLEKLNQLAAQRNLNEISNSVLHQSLQINEKLEEALDLLDRSVRDGLAAAEGRVRNFVGDVEGEVGGLEEEVRRISEDIHQGLSAVLLGQIEADTKKARECYRQLLETFRQPASRNAKSNTLLLLSDPTLLTRQESIKRQQLLDQLRHINFGIKSCVREFRAVFDPAKGPPTRPRGLFTKIRERFQFEYSSPVTWNDPRGLRELKKVRPMLKQMLIQLTNLYLFDSILAFSSNSTKDSLNHGKESVDRYLESSELLLKKFKEDFPPCPVSHPILAALRATHLFCDDDVIKIGGTEAVEFNQKYAVEVGTQCKFECYGELDSILPALTCGPEGKWSQHENETDQHFVTCKMTAQGMPYQDPALNHIQREFNNLSREVMNLKETRDRSPGPLTDLMAQSICQSRQLRHVYAVRRDCSIKESCNQVCANRAKKFQDVTSSSQAGTPWNCFESIHIYVKPVKSEDVGFGDLLWKTYRYGLGACNAKYCGPNYCCCKAARDPVLE